MLSTEQFVTSVPLCFILVSLLIFSSSSDSHAVEQNVAPQDAVTNKEKETEELVMDDRIVVDPKICSGKPTIRGTRIMVKNILGMAAGGYIVSRIVDTYPELTTHDVTAALEHASQVIDEEKVVPRA
jgi:uncharacterized protein (DUF433 family)